MTLRTLTHAELQISPLNVRQTSKPIDALAENIAAEGMLFPLIVHRMDLLEGMDLGGNWPSGSEAVGRKRTAEWGAYAGGRRWRAIGKLIAEGRLPADHPIECIVREFDPARMTDVSLAENLIRHDLDAWEVHAAIARSVDQGHTPAQIAATLGQDEKWVRQQLRLGTLVPEIFTAYVDKKIAVEEAMAYAATEDRELQGLAWRHFHRRPEYERRAFQIRAFLKVGDREHDKLLRFVGADAYRAAGGRFELDLFADVEGGDGVFGSRGRVVDEALLRKLAEQSLEATRQSIRTRTGRKDLRFAKEPPQNAGTTDWSLRIEPEYRGKKVIDLPAGDVVATLAIGEGGQVEVSYWYENRKAKSSAVRAATEAKLKGEDVVTPKAGARSQFDGKPIADGDAFEPSSFYAQTARMAVKDEHGLTADNLEIVRSLRRTLLRGLLVGHSAWTRPDGSGLGRDYLIWSMARQELGRKKHTEPGARGRGDTWAYRDSEPRPVKDYMAEEPLAAQWDAIVRDVSKHAFLLVEDPAESLVLYVALPDEEKNLVAAVLAGQALVRSANVAGWRVRAHDKLAELAGGTDQALRRHWKPTSRFLGLFPKLKRLELAQPFVDAEAFRAWPKQDDKTITGACAGALEQQADWVHPLLAFGAPGPNEGEQDPNVNDKQLPELQVAAGSVAVPEPAQ